MIQLLLARYAVKLGLVVLLAVALQASGVPVYGTALDLLSGFAPNWFPV
ncbi:hypothetical protein [Haloplanus salinarum]|nr:hypothetical protein [Haloplanus salinarum]